MNDAYVDSTAQFLDWFKKPFPGQGIFEFYQREAAIEPLVFAVASASPAISLANQAGPPNRPSRWARLGSRSSGVGGLAGGSGCGPSSPNLARMSRSTRMRGENG
jgi:hypothetical protein